MVGVTPDLCSLAKILGGGLPIGAVCGRADVMEVLRAKPNNPDWNRFGKVPHSGSYNANALSAAAGNAVLEMVATGEPQRRAEALAVRLVVGMNHEANMREVEVTAFHRSSAFYLTTNRFAEELNRHLLLNGVHIHGGFIGWVSSVHTEQDIDQTIEAFGRSLDGLNDEGVL